MNVGFIGLGNMGNPMAANILKAQYNLTVYDLRREMGQPLEAAGANWGISPKSVAAQSDVVLTSLPGPKEVEAVVLGEDGIFAGLNSGGTYIDLSTNSPTTLQKIAEIGASRDSTSSTRRSAAVYLARGTGRSLYLWAANRGILNGFNRCFRASATISLTWDR